MDKLLSKWIILSAKWIMLSVIDTESPTRVNEETLRLLPSVIRSKVKKSVPTWPDPAIETELPCRVKEATLKTSASALEERILRLDPPLKVPKADAENPSPVLTQDRVLPHRT